MRCPTSIWPPLATTEVTEEGITALAQHWHSLSNICFTSTAFTDEGITALAQKWLALSNVDWAKAEVTDTGFPA